METMDTIFSRKSIRKYLPKTLHADIIEDILKAGVNAPSAVDEQPRHFIVINKNELLDMISEFHPFPDLLSNCQPIQASYSP